jgi:preprotein translocase subunit YajC
MHPILHLLAATTTTTKSSKKSSSSEITLIFIVLIFGGAYFLLIRPRQQRMRQQQAQARELSIGDEVVSAGGIVGRVVAIDADVAEVEVSPGVVMTFLRRSISGRPGATANPNRGFPSRNSNSASTSDAWSAQQDSGADADEDEDEDEESPGDQPDQRH